MDNNRTPDFCNYDDSDYQKVFWEEGGRAYEDESEAIAFKRLLPEHGNLMLEIGAGAGRNTPRYGGYDKIIVTDYALTQVQQAKERLGDSPRYVFAAADVYNLPFKSALFDGATMIRVVHHLTEIDPAFAEIQRVMQKDGILILEFANKRNIKSILRWITGKQKWSPFDREKVEFVKLNFDNHPDTIREELTSRQFTVERTLSVSNLRIGSLKKNPNNLGWMLKLESAMQVLFSGLQLSPSIFLRCRKNAGEAISQDAGYFRCPQCGCEELIETAEAVTCPSCGRVYPIVDGIYNFRLE